MSNNSTDWWEQEVKPTESRENNTISVEQNDTNNWSFYHKFANLMWLHLQTRRRK